MDVGVLLVASEPLDLLELGIERVRMQVRGEPPPRIVDPEAAADVDENERIARERGASSDVEEHGRVVVRVVHAGRA